MAKTSTASVKEVFEEEVVTIVAEKKEKTPPKQDWEIKDRTYYLTGAHSPLTYTMAARHTARFPLLWFNTKTGEQKEIRYATNQNSPFVDEQKGESTLGHIIFHNGTLTVPKEKQNLQKLLSLYHPDANKTYAEFDAVAEATDDLDDLMLEAEATNYAINMDVDQGEAILRVEPGSGVSTMSSKAIKRDLILFAKRNPSLFMDLANDENVQLRNIAIKASEDGIIKLSQDQRTFMWGTNDKKLMTVPFDENPYSAMAAYFKTDEGVEVFKSIEKKMK